MLLHIETIFATRNIRVYCRASSTLNKPELNTEMVLYFHLPEEIEEMFSVSLFLSIELYFISMKKRA